MIVQIRFSTGVSFQSAYIRGKTGHTRSSTSLNTVLKDVPAAGKVSVLVHTAGVGSNNQTFDGFASIYIEYLDPVRPYYSAKFSDSNTLAYTTTSALDIEENIDPTVPGQSKFSISSLTGGIDIPGAGTYLIALNIPFKVIDTGEQRCAPVVNIVVANSTYVARQTYMRNASGQHIESSANWFGIVEMTDNSKDIEFDLDGAGAINGCGDEEDLEFNTSFVSGTDTITSNTNGTIYIEKIDSSYGLITLSSNQVTDGTITKLAWDQDPNDDHRVYFEDSTSIDENIFALDINLDLIDVKEAGNYIGGYAGHFQTSSTRGNTRLEPVAIDPVTLASTSLGISQSSYIRGTSGASHVYSSSTMAFPAYISTPSTKIKFKASGTKVDVAPGFSTGTAAYGNLENDSPDASFFLWKRD